MIKLKSLLSTGLGALALGIVTTAAQAGPSGLAGAFDQSSGRSGLAEKVTWYGDGYKGNKSYYGHYHRSYYGLSLVRPPSLWLSRVRPPPFRVVVTERAAARVPLGWPLLAYLAARWQQRSLGALGTSLTEHHSGASERPLAGLIAPPEG